MPFGHLSGPPCISLVFSLAGWDEIDPVKYYFISPALFFCVRFSLHPFTLIKTRLQMQRMITSGSEGLHMVQYKGTFDALQKITRYEGVRALYKGFGVATLGMISGQIYITTYERIRQQIADANDELQLVGVDHIDFVRNGLAGGTSSLLAQLIVNPVDIVSQKRMMHTGLAHKLPGGCMGHLSVFEMIKLIMKKDGLRGFYKGLGASVAVNAPSSAVWWGSYGYFRDRMLKKVKEGTLEFQIPRMVVEAGAGASAGVVSTILTNPMDVARTRLQVEGRIKDGNSLASTLRLMWREEGPMSLFKGLGARLLASVPSSIMVITVYELVKRLSLRDPASREVRGGGGKAGA